MGNWGFQKTYFLGGPSHTSIEKKLAFWGPCRWARFRDSHRSEHWSSVRTPQGGWTSTNGMGSTPHLRNRGFLVRLRGFFLIGNLENQRLLGTLFQLMIGKLVVWGSVVCKGIPGIQTTNWLADLYHVVQLPNKSLRLFQHTELEDIPGEQPLPTLASHWPPKENPNSSLNRVYVWSDRSTPIISI